MDTKSSNKSIDGVSLDARVFHDATPLESPTILQNYETKDPGIETSDPAIAYPQTGLHYHVPDKGAETYELEKFDENRMIIFNHDTFEFDSPREGSKVDVTALIETFEKFRFKIDEPYNNLKRKALLGTIKKFAETDFRSYGCICVAVLTHGHKTPGFLKAYDKRYSEYEIFKHFDASKNPTLAGKPIIFIIQACRGREPAPKVPVEKKKSTLRLDRGNDWKHYYVPTEADRAVFHSSYPGKASISDTVTGSWFIQELCKKINERALTHDLETIFRLVRRGVALHDDERKKNWKQMPVVTSTTLREINLAPTKHDAKERPRLASAVKCVLDDPQLLDKLEDLHQGAASSTLQHEKERLQPTSSSVLKYVTNSSQPSVQREELRLGAASSTLQCEKERPQPTSYSGFKYVTGDLQLSEKREELRQSAASSTLQCEKERPQPTPYSVFKYVTNSSLLSEKRKGLGLGASSSTLQCEKKERPQPTSSSVFNYVTGDSQLSEKREDLRQDAASNTFQREKEQLVPDSSTTCTYETDDTQLSEKLDELRLGAASSTLQHENEQPRPPSPFVFLCEVDDPKVYPLSHQIAEKLVCLGPTTVENSTPNSGGATPVLMKLHHLPCCCFVEYFDYLKNCLEIFCNHNSDDAVAKTLLSMAKATERGQEFNLQRFYHIQNMWEHLETNKQFFPPREGFNFIHRMYVPPTADET